MERWWRVFSGKIQSPKKKLIILWLIFLFFNKSVNSIENKILLKIENQIITSLDVNNEYK